MNKTGYGHEMILAVSTQTVHHPRYRGRFAPSPTGPLHAGSLATALGSWLDARSRGGQWLVRIEDLDTPRCVAGADRYILGQLRACGLFWDEEVSWQSEDQKAYQNALEGLYCRSQIYACTCSRQTIANALRIEGRLRPRNQEQVYPGTCRAAFTPQGDFSKEAHAVAWRIAVPPDQTIAFTDAELGPQKQHLSQDVGDFVLRRADGVFTYQLAVVIDDGLQGITHIVRGADLLSNTARQIYLQGVLGLPTPCYRHLPLVLDAHGEKLSKQTLAGAINTNSVAAVLESLQTAALHLGLHSLKNTSAQTIAEWLAFATNAWVTRAPALRN